MQIRAKKKANKAERARQLFYILHLFNFKVLWTQMGRHVNGKRKKWMVSLYFSTKPKSNFNQHDSSKDEKRKAQILDCFFYFKQQ